MYNEQVLEGFNNSQLHIRMWTPDSTVIGCVHIIHGLAEHGGRYNDFAVFLMRKGFVVWAHDHRQHGYSVYHDEIGMFGEDDTWEAMVEDVSVVQRAFAEAYKDLPMFMLGHSKGSLVLRSYVQMHPTELAGIILMGSPVASLLLAKIGTFVARMVHAFKPDKPSPFMDNLAIGSYNKTVKNPKTSSDWISQDEIMVDRYISDPLSCYVYNAMYYGQLASGSLIANNPSMMKAFPKTKTLFISGDKDPCGQFGKGIKKLADTYKSFGVDSDVIIMENMRHEVLNEIERRKTFEVISDWLQKRL